MLRIQYSCVVISGDISHSGGGKWSIPIKLTSSDRKIKLQRYEMARDIKKVDAKGRFFIPAKQKELLGTEVVVTNSLDVGYLCVYSKDHFENIVKTQLSKLNSMDSNVRKIKRAIIGEACEVNVDSQGRISVNSELWERIGANPGDEICVFNDDGKLDICTKNFYDNEDHDLSGIEGLETKYYVEGL